MAIVFDGATSRIILDSASTSAAEIWSRWADWYADNSNWLPAMRQAGGDDLGGGLSIPPYIFLLNGWRVRPMESNHLLNITGNLFVDGGGQPVVATLGSYNVSVQYTVPVQAQGISTSGSVGPSAEEIANAVWSNQNGALLHKSLINKREIKKVGEDWTLFVYDDDGTTPILSKVLKDVTGAQIADLSGGVLAKEEASSV